MVRFRQANEAGGPPELLLDDDDDDCLAELTANPGMSDLLPRWTWSDVLSGAARLCVRPLRTDLSGPAADGWADLTAASELALARKDVPVQEAVGLMSRWIRSAYEQLDALYAVDLVPYPGGSYPTPRFPHPPTPAREINTRNRRAAVASLKIKEAIARDPRLAGLSPSSIQVRLRIGKQACRDALSELHSDGLYHGHKRVPKPRGSD